MNTNQKEALLASAYEGWRTILARSEHNATLGVVLGMDVSEEDKAKAWLARSMRQRDYHFFTWSVFPTEKTVRAHHASGCTLEMRHSDVVLRYNPDDAEDLGGTRI